MTNLEHMANVMNALLKALNGLTKNIEPVLTREERRYLKSVLAPFETSGGRIVKRGEEIDPIISIDREGQRYPYFSILILHLINIEFKFDGLNFNHVYSFEELGL